MDPALTTRGFFMSADYHELRRALAQNDRVNEPLEREPIDF
jgi:hypothetical protein